MVIVRSRLRAAGLLSFAHQSSRETHIPNRTNAAEPPRRGAIARRLLPLASAALLAACGGGSDPPAPSKPDLLGEPPVACAGADLTGLQTTVFVSTVGADSASCGSSAGAACKSVQQGIANCSGAACGVLVGPGTYDLDAVAFPLPRTVELREGVSVIGGCVFDGSADPRYRSVLRGPAGLPAVSASAIGSATLLHGFVVIAGWSAQVDGTASIAMAVDASPALTLRNLRLVGGPGANGANGAQDLIEPEVCGSGGAPADCSTAGGVPGGPQPGRFVGATWVGGAGGHGGTGMASATPSQPGGQLLCGKGGTGGQHGGASIGLLLNDSLLSLDPSVVVFAGPGGNGGGGGDGYPLRYGGAGAGAAGGNGGPSIGLVANGSAPLPVVNEGVFAGQPGAAGQFGQGGFGEEKRCNAAPGARGQAGTSLSAYRVGSNWLAQNFGPFKGVAPFQLTQGQQVVSPSQRYSLGLDLNGNLRLVDAGVGALWQSGSSAQGAVAQWGTGETFCVTSESAPPVWCAAMLPGPIYSFGNDAFLAVEEGHIAIYNAAGRTLWSAP